MSEALNCSFNDILDMSLINFIMYGKTLNTGNMNRGQESMKRLKDSCGSSDKSRTYKLNSLEDLQKTLEKII